MNEVASPRIHPMTEAAVHKTYLLESVMRELPQVDIPTQHFLHGGLYARTIRIPAGVVIVGAFIKVPTLLVVSGHVTVTAGADEPVRVEGYNVIAASAGRRQAFMAHADTDMTMLFATSAKTIEAAEDEFTNEAHLLASRQPGATNTVCITGE